MRTLYAKTCGSISATYASMLGIRSPDIEDDAVQEQQSRIVGEGASCSSLMSSQHIVDVRQLLIDAGQASTEALMPVSAELILSCLQPASA